MIVPIRDNVAEGPAAESKKKRISMVKTRENAPKESGRGQTAGTRGTRRSNHPENATVKRSREPADDIHAEDDQVQADSNDREQLKPQAA